MTTKEPNGDQNFRALAEETLDLWQNYLDSCASDPKAKAEFTKMMMPMNQMFAPWASMMQQGFKANSNDPASAAEGTNLASEGLEERVAELESRVAELETLLAKIMAAASASCHGGSTTGSGFRED
jgi:hypothetical protein